MLPTPNNKQSCSPISTNALLPVKTSSQSTKNSSHSSIPRTNYTPLKNSSTPLHCPTHLTHNTTLTTKITCPTQTLTSKINDPPQYKINTIHPRKVRNHREIFFALSRLYSLTGSRFRFNEQIPASTVPFRTPHYRPDSKYTAESLNRPKALRQLFRRTHCTPCKCPALYRDTLYIVHTHYQTLTTLPDNPRYSLIIPEPPKYFPISPPRITLYRLFFFHSPIHLPFLEILFRNSLLSFHPFRLPFRISLIFLGAFAPPLEISLTFPES